MIRAKNYKTVFKFVKVVSRMLVASFFSRHSLEDLYFQLVIAKNCSYCTASNVSCNANLCVIFHRFKYCGD